MEEKAKYREIEKCHHLLNDKTLRDINRLSVTAYLKSLEAEKNE